MRCLHNSLRSFAQTMRIWWQQVMPDIYIRDLRQLRCGTACGWDIASSASHQALSGSGHSKTSGLTAAGEDRRADAAGG